MKIRTGFVSNSSSSSFVVAIDPDVLDRVCNLEIVKSSYKNLRELMTLSLTEKEFVKYKLLDSINDNVSITDVFPDKLEYNIYNDLLEDSVWRTAYGIRETIIFMENVLKEGKKCVVYITFEDDEFYHCCGKYICAQSMTRKRVADYLHVTLTPGDIKHTT